MKGDGCLFVPLREVTASRGKVISDKDLELLLDRSDLLGEETRHRDLWIYLLLSMSDDQWVTVEAPQ